MKDLDWKEVVKMYLLLISAGLMLGLGFWSAQLILNIVLMHIALM